MRIGTLFSGIGAPEQGAKRVYDDLEMVFACEWDKFARQSLKAIYEIDNDHFHQDINEMDGTQYKNKVDIIIGGSPCQDFSIAGLRAGIDGNKGQLIWQYYRIIKEIMPPIFIYENVKGMTSDKNGQTLKDFLEVFRDLGYSCHSEVLNTKDYGVPQNRERIYIIGFLDHEHYYRFNYAPKQKLEKRLRDILEDEVDEKYYLSEKLIAGFMKHNENHKAKGTGFLYEPKTVDDIAVCLRANAALCPTDNTIKIEGTLDIKGTDQIRRVYGVDGVDGVDGVAATLTTMQGGSKEPKIMQLGRGFNKGGIHEVSPTITTNSFECNNHIIESKILTQLKKEIEKNPDANIFQKTDSRTMTANIDEVGTLQAARLDKVPFFVNKRIRKLTPLECWRLQDFPDQAHDKAKEAGVSNSQLYKQAGNSMSVNVLEMIFTQIEASRTKQKDTLF